MKTPANKTARKFKRRRSGGPRLNLQLLINSDSVKENFSNTVKDHLDQVGSPTSVNEMHDAIKQSLDKGRGQIPVLPRRNRNTIPWDTDTELAELHQTRTNLRKKKLTDNTKKALKEVSKKIKVKVKQIKNNNSKKKK